MSSCVQLFKKKKGITGLETAIILIAFVIVASVLSYVVISAGLFSSQKAKAAVTKGLEQSGSTLELKGNVVAMIGTPVPTPTHAAPRVFSSAVSKIALTVGLVPGGSALDLTPNPPPTLPIPSGWVPATPKLIISYSDTTQMLPSLYYTVDYINANNGDDMLDPQEIATITVYVDQAYYADDTSINYMPYPVASGTGFTLTITPPDSSIMPIERMIPSGAKAEDGWTALVNLN